ncbi:Apolipoprotein L 7c [Apodemus speciosus]|uniref:Apolipoprotein L 7c n=1 Tax=Apodemus speciosus TaxID=105296 RepID=A0ABQ0FJX0_APOSI
MGTPGKRFIDNIPEYFLDERSLEDLQLLLTEEEAWKQFVEEAVLREALAEIFHILMEKMKTSSKMTCRTRTREKEKDALSKALGEIVADTDTEDEDELQDALLHKESFLDAISRKLRALADKVDKVHKDCTISQVVAGSTSAVSGVLTILGLTLAPVTAGVSLALSATGLGLGAAAAVTSVSTIIVEKVNVASAKAEASKLVPTNKDTMEDIKDILDQSGHRLLSVSTNSIQNIKGIQKSISAIQQAKVNPRLVTKAQRLMTTGKTSTQTIEQVKEAFGGTALAMTKGARIMAAAFTGFFLLLDVVSLVQESKHLHEGAKSQSAAELRQQAHNLELKLEELKQVHDSLIQ